MEVAAKGGEALADGGREVSGMVDIRHSAPPASGAAAVDTPAGHARSPLVGWLAGALVVAVLAVAGLGLWVFLDHRSSADQQAAMTAVTAFMAAKNASDPDAVQAATTSDVVETGLVDGALVEGPMSGTAFTRRFTLTLGPGFHMTKVGPATMAGDDVIAVPTRVTLPKMDGYDKTGIAVYRVEDVDGTAKIAEIVWLPWS